MTINRDILNMSIRHMVWLERYKTGVVKKILGLMNKTTNDLRQQLTNRLLEIEERGYDVSQNTRQRIEKLITEVEALRASMYGKAQDTTVKTLNDFSVYEMDYQAGLVDDGLNRAGVKIVLDRPSMTQLKALVISRPFQGRLLKDWFDGLQANDARRISDAIKIGIAEGQTTAQIVQRIIGTRAMNYRNGILETSRNEAWAVVSTAIGHVANQASDELYKANTDIIKGVLWVSVLDNRTTAICQARDGKIYPVTSGPRPPAHFRCRSRVVPYLGESSVSGTRASMFGQVPDSMTYEEWLKRQSIHVQEEVLGVKKAKLFRDGGLTLDRFVDNSGRSYTLDELRVRDAHAWHKAFPDA